MDETAVYSQTLNSLSSPQGLELRSPGGYWYIGTVYLYHPLATTLTFHGLAVRIIHKISLRNPELRQERRT